MIVKLPFNFKNYNGYKPTTHSAPTIPDTIQPVTDLTAPSLDDQTETVGEDVSNVVDLTQNKKKVLYRRPTQSLTSQSFQC